MNPSLKSRILAEWRGLPEEPFTKDTAVPVGGLVESVLGRLGLKTRIREEEIKAAWLEVVGDFLAKHSAPAALENGTLVVHVLQPTVHYELERVWKRKLLLKLQEKFGKTTVREIRFRLG
jgi:predicted nucleic acid-binding Zn ribbon protein